MHILAQEPLRALAIRAILPRGLPALQSIIASRTTVGALRTVPALARAATLAPATLGMLYRDRHALLSMVVQPAMVDVARIVSRMGLVLSIVHATLGFHSITIMLCVQQ